MPTADLSAAADAVELAARVVEQGTQALADGGGPAVAQALGYDLAHAAAPAENARAMLDYGTKGDHETYIASAFAPDALGVTTTQKFVRERGGGGSPGAA